VVFRSELENDNIVLNSDDALGVELEGTLVTDSDEDILGGSQGSKSGSNGEETHDFYVIGRFGLDSKDWIRALKA